MTITNEQKQLLDSVSLRTKRKQGKNQIFNERTGIMLLKADSEQLATLLTYIPRIQAKGEELNLPQKHINWAISSALVETAPWRTIKANLEYALNSHLVFFSKKFRSVT